VKVNVYIDGFNLYYGALKGTPYRWLDVQKLIQSMMPSDQIHKIKYFTALVTARPNDPDQPVRQQTYLRALSTIPNLSITYGRFQMRQVRMPLVNPTNGREALVYRTDEKGSDVNLASHLLHDGHKKDYELAVVVSNDSDLAEPIRLVSKELGLPVGLLNPQIKSERQSVDLRKVATFIKTITKKHLQNSLFPDTLSDSNGTFFKPKHW
jgi:uncharacterized LabA/DUF88 family protein